MIIETLVVGSLQTNCYLVGDEQTGACAVVDPGDDADQILRALGHAQVPLTVQYVIDTHAHFDHILANRDLLRALSVQQESRPELILHAAEAPLLAADGGAAWFGFTPVPSPKPDRFVADGDVLSVGQISLQVLHTPGHSPGSISLYCAAEGVLFAGDVLFRQGVGRHDLPGGDWAALMDIIRDRLFVLPDETRVYPGHGPATTIGLEKRDNLLARGL